MNDNARSVILGNSFDVCLEADDTPLLIRTGCFLRHPVAALHVPQKKKLIFSRLRQQIYYMFRVEQGEFTLTTPFPNAYITCVWLKPGEILFLRLENVLAISESISIEAKWRFFDGIALLTHRFRHTYLKGPGQVIWFGLGGAITHSLQESSAYYDQNTVIGWTNSLAVGVGTRSSVGSTVLNKENVVLDKFEGTGTVFLQTASARASSAAFSSSKASFIDYLNLLVGIRP